MVHSKTPAINSPRELTKLAYQASATVKYYWLSSCFILTLLMITLGASTRLTNSGLSMVDWKLILGIIPPLTLADWQQAFNAYKQHPEYQLLYPQMSLNQFQFIFAFEYAHRMLGRIIGLAVLVPFGLLWLRKQLSKQEKFRFSMLSILVFIQGLVGWFMVKSGLIHNPHISHYRLALHFFLALAFLSYILVLLLFYRIHTKKENFEPTSLLPPTKHWLSLPLLNGVTILLILQILYGTFMAGLDAGYVSSTYPKMFEKWIPFASLSSAITEHHVKTLIENTTWIHFIHRHLGILTSLALIYFVLQSLFRYYRKSAISPHSDTLPTYTLYGLGLLSLLQPLVGILTVIWQVPLSLALIHQLLAVFLFEGIIILYFYRLSTGLFFIKIK